MRFVSVKQRDVEGTGIVNGDNAKVAWAGTPAWPGTLEQLVQEASTDDMLFDVATLISLLSVAHRLEPVDVIVSGTPAGVGMARKPQLWMKPGDVCEVEIERVGLLRSPITAEEV